MKRQGQAFAIRPQGHEESFKSPVNPARLLSKAMGLTPARGFRRIRRLVNTGAPVDRKSPSALLASEEWSWEELDRVFTISRRGLYGDRRWLFGPKRTHEVAREAFDGLSHFGSIEGKVYCDFGCGPHHPWGVSAAMFLNGASRAIAVDRVGADPARAAEALFDLLMDAAIRPDLWHWSGIEREDFLSRIFNFDLEALRLGNLTEGINDLPLGHQVCDISDLQLAAPVEAMSSRAVFEHLLDLKGAVSKLYDLMAPGGLAFHHIDLRDHRFYRDPSQYHPWSFLAQKDDRPGGECNRLRPGEIEKCLKECGFEILMSSFRRETVPEGFRKELKGRFAGMPKEELEITGAAYTIRRPEAWS